MLYYDYATQDTTKQYNMIYTGDNIVYECLVNYKLHVYVPIIYDVLTKPKKIKINSLTLKRTSKWVQINCMNNINK